MINKKRVILEILSRKLYHSFESAVYKRVEDKDIFHFDDSSYSFVILSENEIEFKWQNLIQSCSANFIFSQTKNQINVVCNNLVFIDEGEYISFPEERFIVLNNDKEGYKIFSMTFLNRLTDHTISHNNDS